jgi:hypothetical protein
MIIGYPKTLIFHGKGFGKLMASNKILEEFF